MTTNFQTKASLHTSLYYSVHITQHILETTYCKKTLMWVENTAEKYFCAEIKYS